MDIRDPLEEEEKNKFTKATVGAINPAACPPGNLTPGKINFGPRIAGQIESRFEKLKPCPICDAEETDIAHRLACYEAKFQQKSSEMEVEKVDKEIMEDFIKPDSIEIEVISNGYLIMGGGSGRTEYVKSTDELCEWIKNKLARPDKRGL